MVASPSLGDDRPRPLAQRLAGEIRRLRKAAGLSQPELAALIGYTRQYVSLAERPNRCLPSAELVRAIDDALRAGGALVALRQRADAERKACRPATSPIDAAAAAGTGRATTEDLLITRHGTSVASTSGEISDDTKPRELLRLLSMIGVLVTTPDADDQLDSNRLDYSSPNAGPLDGVAVDEYAMLNTRFNEAVPMLDLAARLARRGDQSLSTRYWVATVQAQAFAGLGEVDACRRTLDVAEQVNGLSDDASNGGWLRFDGSRLAEERGACYVELRCHGLAEATLGAALQQNLSARRRGSVLTDLAMIGTQRGDVDQLVIYADAALEMAVQTGSGFISRKLQALQGHLAPLLGNSRVRQLSHEIMSLPGGFRT